MYNDGKAKAQEILQKYKDRPLYVNGKEIDKDSLVWLKWGDPSSTYSSDPVKGNVFVGTTTDGCEFKGFVYKSDSIWSFI